MQIMVFLLILLAIMAGIDMSEKNSNTWDVTESSAVEKAMLSYNHEIIKQCTQNSTSSSSGSTITCNPGKITLYNYPKYMLNEYDFYQNNFQSVYDQNNNRIITAWVPGNTSMKGDMNQIMGLVTSALVEDSDTSVYTGFWNSSTQTVNQNNLYTYTVQKQYPLDNTASYINNQNVGTWVGSATKPSISLPQGTGGLQLINGAPVIVTQF